jgi:shikimate dehydrogenase
MKPLQQYALIGFPIDQSPSPHMHNAAFQHLGLNACYHLRPTHPTDIPTVLQEIAQEKWQGLNITIPLKTLFYPCFTADEKALRTGAANTLYKENNQWRVTNTDITGVLKPLQTYCTTLEHCLVLGSGGAARAASYACSLIKGTVHIACRNIEEGTKILHTLPLKNQGSVFSLYDQNTLQKIFPTLNTVVQSTPIGKKGESHILPWDFLQKGCVAFDLVYTPEFTPFLTAAKNHGAHAIEGWNMLLEQGIEAFELWTHAQAPKKIMHQALMEKLKPVLP